MPRASFISSIVSILAAALLAGASGAPARAERIVVKGIAPQDMQREVQKMFHEQWDSQIPRWDAKLCPVVVGLADPYRQVVLDHLYHAASALVGPVDRKCVQHNVFIVFSGDGTAAFNLILSKVPTLGDGYDSAGVSSSDFDLPDRRLIAALREDRPVRWYRTTSMDPAAGNIAVSGAIPIDGPSGVMPGHSTVYRLGVNSINKGTQARTTATFVIVDTNLAQGSSWRQLADYIAVVVLADPEMDNDFNHNSIMSLFDGGQFQPGAPARLTALDSAMLDGLYAADPAQDAHSEQVDIARFTESRATFVTDTIKEP